MRVRELFDDHAADDALLSQHHRPLASSEEERAVIVITRGVLERNKVSVSGGYAWPAIVINKMYRMRNSLFAFYIHLVPPVPRIVLQFFHNSKISIYI